MTERRLPRSPTDGSTVDGGGVEEAGGRLVGLKPYPIGTAARLAGIAPETLRIWERRYHLLSPGRTDGGHRLYSEDDVRVLRAVRTLVEGSMRIGAVAKMTREQILEAALRLEPAPRLPAPTSSSDEDIAHLVADIVDAARELDTARVTTLLDRPLLVRDGLEVVLTIYLPLMKRVGDLWHQGRLPIAVEHFIEKLVTARLHALVQSTPAPTGGQLALCACPPDERHEAALLTSALLLKRAGFSVAYFGGDLPAAELENAARRLAPSVVILGATSSLSATAQAELPAVLNREPLRSVPLIVGGAAAPTLVAALTRPAQVCSDLNGLIAVARRVAA